MVSSAVIEVPLMKMNACQARDIVSIVRVQSPTASQKEGLVKNDHLPYICLHVVLLESLLVFRTYGTVLYSARRLRMRYPQWDTLL